MSFFREDFLFVFGAFFLFSCVKEEEPNIGLDFLRTWEVKEVAVGDLNPLNEFHFINENVGFVMGLTLMKTRNGGGSFTDLTSYLHSRAYRQLAVLDENHLIYATDSVNQERQIMVTTFHKSLDGGKTWSKHRVDNFLFSDISFVTPEFGFGFANHFLPDQDTFFQIYRTEDGGKTWDVVEEIDVKKFTYLRFVWKTRELGFVIGQKGAHYRTMDGGMTWEPFLSSLPGKEEADFYPVDATTFYDLEVNGTSRVDSSSNSRKLTDPKKLFVLSQIGNDVVGIKMGEDCRYFDPCENFLASSTDGGITWNIHRSVDYFNFYFGVQEIRPGLVVFPQKENFDDPGKFVFFKKK